MNAPAVAPPTGDYLVVAVKDGALAASVGPFADRDQAVRAMRRQPGQAVLVRGASVLEGVRIPSPSTMARLRAQVAERGAPRPQAPEAAPVEPEAPEAEAPRERPEKPLRVARRKPTPAGHCEGCGEALPSHSVVCPLVPAVLPGERAAGPVMPAVARRCADCGEPDPDHLRACPSATRPPEDPTPEETPMPKPAKKTAEKTAPADTTDAPPACAKCSKYPRDVATPTTPEGTEEWCRHCRRVESMRRSGTTSTPKRTAKGLRRGQRPSQVKRPAAAPRPADPADALAAELRALLDSFLAERGLTRAEVVAIVDERVGDLARKVLS